MESKFKILAYTAAGLGVTFVALTSLPQWSYDGISRVQFLQNRAQLIAVSGVYLSSLHERNRTALVSYAETRGLQELERIRSVRREMDRVSSVLRTQLDGNGPQELLRRYEASRQELISVDEQYIRAVERGATRETADIREQQGRHRQSTNMHLQAVLSGSNRQLQTVIDDAASRETRMKWTLAGRALTLGFVLWLLVQIYWSILRPLRQLTAAADRIAEGNFSAGMDATVERGQIGDLARSFERMRGRIIESHRMLELRIAQRTCELRRNQERLELAITANAAGIWDWEPQRRRITYNASWASILGYSYEELDSSEVSFFSRVHPEEVSVVRSRFAEHLEGRQPHYESEHRVRRKSGEWCWVAEHGRVVERDEQGAAIRVIGLMRDVTNRHEAEEEILGSRRELEKRSLELESSNRELEDKNAELAQFVYTVSHDLKSPLVTMKGFVGVLKDGLSAGDCDLVTDSLRRVERAANHMCRLIEGLLKLSRAGRTLSGVAVVDVSALLRDITADLRTNLAELQTTLEIQEDLPGVVADGEAIRRVFENLLGNAVKYGSNPNGTKIEVGARTVDGEVRYFVRDNGQGVSPEFREKIFGLFQRLESDEEGTGIGLAIVAKIMRAHDGRVWVESSPGEGATFWLAFDGPKVKDLASSGHVESTVAP